MLSDTDLDFLVSRATPDARDPARLKALIRGDAQFRTAIVGDDRVFEGVAADEEIFVKISPALYFEVLLRRALKDLNAASHTVEESGRQRIPVFDASEVSRILSRPDVLDYLASMLASFTRIRSYVTHVRLRHGVRRRVRFNDMDVDSLLTMCASSSEEERLGYYRRIGDVCLFVSGVFPGHAGYGLRYAGSGQLRPMSSTRLRRGLEDYERDGRRYYGLAQAHPAARALGLTEVFGLLSAHFAAARKPLSFIAARYLHANSRALFGVQA
jgi:hypothetical protein